MARKKLSKRIVKKSAKQKKRIKRNPGTKRIKRKLAAKRTKRKLAAKRTKRKLYIMKGGNILLKDVKTKSHVQKAGAGPADRRAGKTAWIQKVAAVNRPLQDRAAQGHRIRRPHRVFKRVEGGYGAWARARRAAGRRLARAAPRLEARE